MWVSQAAPWSKIMSHGWTGHMNTLALSRGTEDSQQPLCCQALSSYPRPSCHCIRRMRHGPNLPFQPASPRSCESPACSESGDESPGACSARVFNECSKYQFGCHWGQNMPERASPRCSWLNGRLKWYLPINYSLASVWCWVSQLIDGNNWSPAHDVFCDISDRTQMIWHDQLCTLQISMFGNGSSRKCVCVLKHMYVCVYVCICVWTCTCTCTFTSIYVCICMHCTHVCSLRDEYYFIFPT